jgi:hypothetical protein
MNYKVGDKVVFDNIMRDSAEDWMMSERQYAKVKSYLGRIGTISEIEKRYNDNETVSYFITVQFISGFTLHRVNRLAFTPYEVDFDFI